MTYFSVMTGRLFISAILPNPKNMVVVGRAEYGYIMKQIPLKLMPSVLDIIYPVEVKRLLCRKTTYSS